MISHLRYSLFLLLMSLASLLYADALVVDRSIEASSVAQYDIDRSNPGVQGSLQEVERSASPQIPEVPLVDNVEVSNAGSSLWLRWLPTVLVLLALISVLLLWRARAGKGEPALPAIATFLFLVAAIAAAHYSRLGD